MNGVDTYVTESMLTKEEEDKASGKPIAKARPRQKPAVTLTSVSIPVRERKWIGLKTAREKSGPNGCVSSRSECVELSRAGFYGVELVLSRLFRWRMERMERRAGKLAQCAPYRNGSNGWKPKDSFKNVIDWRSEIDKHAVDDVIKLHTEYHVRAPAASYAASVPVVEYITPATSYVTPASVVEYITPAPLKFVEAVLHEIDEELCLDDIEELCLCGTYESKAYLEAHLAQLLISFGRFKI